MDVAALGCAAVPPVAHVHLERARAEAAHAEARRLGAEVGGALGLEAAALVAALLPATGHPVEEGALLRAVAIRVGAVDGAVVEQR